MYKNFQEYKNYANYYKIFYDEIEERKKSFTTEKKVLIKSLASKIAEEYITKKTPEYKILNLWVIFSSLISKKDSLVELGY